MPQKKMRRVDGLPIGSRFIHNMDGKTLKWPSGETALVIGIQPNHSSGLKPQLGSNPCLKRLASFVVASGLPR